ncbi:MAG: hypothetical protein HY726_17700 [Candidatus Rokubacteria bacterium]|nr:hypothetical protein [Candidatus Rokubacteria bacterium]
MGQQGIRDLVGRVMLDPDFFAELVRAPEAVLDEYELTREERVALLLAVAKARSRPTHRQAQTFHRALVKRWST